jgi:hypothetical protein
MARTFVQGLAFVGVAVGLGAFGAGCLDRPVTAQEPTIKTNFTSAVNQNGINKVDLLFDIDNSASMGDKQAYLIQAIPLMVQRLVTPRCMDDTTGLATSQNASPSDGTCPAGSTPEFSAVHDMHIGVVTSSLGSRLGDIGTCDSTTQVKSTSGTSVLPYDDDQGHLVNRTGKYGSTAGASETSLPASEGGGFLYWFPTLGNTGKTAVTPPQTITAVGAAGQTDTLVGDFAEMVGGVGESGCGIESQLESWYRFLIQPDPYASLVFNPGTCMKNGSTSCHVNSDCPSANGVADECSGTAVWNGVDTTIIQQRHDFLRPDSLVAVIVLSDENDSEIDVRSYRGTGFEFMRQTTYQPPRATTACESDPNNASCQSCAVCGSSCSTDANCSQGNFNSDNDWGYNLNLRHVHMMQKYGLDPQFPLSRYYVGLTSQTVPNRLGEYPNSDSSYASNNNCTNPLFAKTLPQATDVGDATALAPTEINTTLCKLPTGATRTASDVFYAHIGGVPHQLLQSSAGDDECPGSQGSCAAHQYMDSSNKCADCPQKDTLSQSDWISVLGQGPSQYTGANPKMVYDYTNIDPHMIESEVPRNTLTGVNSNPSVSTLSPAAFTGNPAPDPVNGREWTTQSGTHSLPVDREYACIFQLPPANQRDCAALAGNTIEGNSCDCVPGDKDKTTPWSSGGAPTVTGNQSDEVPPLCAKQSSDGSITSSVGDYTVQVYAKAYPTIRQLMLANMMGTQGIVSSLCPIHTTADDPTSDPLYGYTPAVNAIVNRLKAALKPACVPQLTVDTSTGMVPCLILVSFPAGSDNAPTSEADCASIGGGAFEAPTPSTVLTQFQAAQKASAGDGGTSLAGDITCELKQVATNGKACAGTSANGWCYVTDVGSGASCPQEIQYSSQNMIPNGAVINLQCIATNSASSGTGSGK